eukprot:413968-Rhodomonas_salina.2
MTTNAISAVENSTIYGDTTAIYDGITDALVGMQTRSWRGCCRRRARTCLPSALSSPRCGIGLQACYAMSGTEIA